MIKIMRHGARTLHLARIVTVIMALALPSLGWAQARGIGRAPTTASPTEARLALVIGNAAYETLPLRNPVNDARLMEQALKNAGFEVIMLTDAGKKDMLDGIKSFEKRLADQGKKGVGLFYYAGHGLQVDGKNYAVPVGADIDIEEDVSSEGVDIARVLGRMERSGSRVNIIILDACRDNPFSRSFRSGSRGLARVSSAPTGSIIAYATAPGKVAADGEGQNGLYTSRLVQHINQPGLTIEQVFKRTRAEVIRLSEKAQVPWENSSFTEDFYFKGGSSVSGVAGGTTAAVPTVVLTQTSSPATVQTKPVTLPPVAPFPKKRSILAHRATSVYFFPDESFGKQGQLTQDQQVVATGAAQGGWLEIEWQNGLGYVRTTHFKVEASVVPDPSPGLADANSSAPQNPVTPERIRVRQDGTGDVRSIAEALQRISEGGTILVGAGTYRESLVVSQSVHLKADGPQQQVILRPDGGPCIHFKGGEGSVKGFTLHHAKPEATPCVLVTAGHPTIEGNDVSGTYHPQEEPGKVTGSSVEIKGKAAKAIVRGNRIHDSRNGGAGIDVKDGGGGVIEGNEIYRNERSGIGVSGEGSAPTIRNNKVYDGKHNGIWVGNGGGGLIEGNEIHGNALAGIQVGDEGSAPTIRNNKVYDGKHNGIRVGNGGGGVIEGNDIYRNAYSGIHVGDEGSAPTIRNNKVYDGKQSGVWVHKGGGGVIEGNEIHGNALAGIHVGDEGSAPTIRNNKVYDGKQRGIWVYEGGGGLIEGNEIHGNVYYGIDTTDSEHGDGYPQIGENQIYNNGLGSIDR